MNFTRLNYDSCTYKSNLKSSVGPGDYLLATPTIECHNCFPSDPATIPRGMGASICVDKPLVDVDSELMGITRKATNCPDNKYLPSANPFCTKTNLVDCRSLPNEDTRVSNPPCTLRSTGWNRWEWLCQDPQDKALIPFDFNINYRMIAKDNHRPCVQDPISQVPTLPPRNKDDAMHQEPMMCAQEADNLPSVGWRKACEYAPYGI